MPAMAPASAAAAILWRVGEIPTLAAAVSSLSIILSARPNRERSSTMKNTRIAKRHDAMTPR